MVLINPWIAACKHSSEKNLPGFKYGCIIRGSILLILAREVMFFILCSYTL